MNPKLNWFFEKAEKWKSSFEALRRIVLESGLVEELKWGVPCYTYNGANTVLIHGFKDYCAILFTKGSLIKDTEGILVQQTENVQAARQIRFTNVEEVTELETAIKSYLTQAIEIEKSGLKVPMKETKDFDVPEEFLVKLEETPGLQDAFEALTPGRQKAYLLFFGGAKQSKTREARVEKYIAQILSGKGLDD